MSSAKFRPRDGFRPKLIALSVAACFSLSSTQSLGNPTGGTVGSGSASFASSGNTLTITNSANAIINWQSFSIGVNEITRFLQTSGSSAVLNRVVGANGRIPQSVIDGILSSNGRVFLLNPSGIVIGSTARIDVAGFVASSLNLSDQDFRDGRMRFTETPGAGAVSNAGIIDTTSGGPGGRVFLVGPDVQNSGVIRSPQGEIVLAAGKSVELVSENSPFVTVRLVADAEQALNVGRLISDSGRIGMFGALVRQGGVAEANSAVVGANGEIRLVATKDLTLDAGSRTTANGPSGGNVLLQAEGGTNLVSGTVEARGSSGQGGTIQALGVRVGVIGAGVIDASGDAGGGTVLVGGDAHGANPNVQNADRTLIGPNGVIRADAGTTGDGGRVIVWADGDTRFYGSASARGGSQSGDGGFIETSGKLGLDVQGGQVDLRAPNGQWGTWLLDPTNVSIVYGNNGQVGTELITNVNAFAGVAQYGGVVTTGTVQAEFTRAGTVRIQATNDVGLYADLPLTNAQILGGVFEVRAQHDINLAAGGAPHTITMTNGASVILSASDNGIPTIAPGLGTTGTGAILGSGNIVTNGGAVTLSGVGIAIGTVNTSSPAAGIVGPGTVSMLSSTGDIDTGSITTRSFVPTSAGGSIALTTNSGNIFVHGAIDTRGADGSSISIGSNNGTGGGSVILSRSSLTLPGTVRVEDNILTGGGKGAPATNLQSSAYGQGGSGGTGGSLLITGPQTAMLGNILVYGNINAPGGTGADAFAGGSLGSGGNGGTGGAVELQATGAITIGAPNGSIDASGGNAGKGATNANALAGAGGNGGTGGLISVYGGSLAVNDNVSSKGGAGGAGSDGSATSIGGSGGYGGTGGFVSLRANSSSVAVTGSVNADGGNAGNGGAFGGLGGGASSGGVYGGGNGGSVSVYGAQDVTIAGNISSNGGQGGAGGNNGSVSVTGLSVNALIGLGSRGGTGGSIIVTSYGGSITTGNITASGGAGGAGGSGGSAAAYSSSPSNILSQADAGTGGTGGSGGGVNVTSNGIYGNVTTGSITVSGGAGGAGGANSLAYASATYGLAGTGYAQAFANAGSGGVGGFGGSINATALFYGSVTVGAITTSGGLGGAGGASSISFAFASAGAGFITVDTFADAGLGGDGGSVSSVNIDAGGNISTGIINASGGAGGAGGNSSSANATSSGNGSAGANAHAANGGTGRFGGFLSIFGGGTTTTGAITNSGGAGGDGGVGAGASASATSAAGLAATVVDVGSGGIGGGGGFVEVDGASVTVGGNIVSRGGAGGIGRDSGASPGARAGHGGDGGEGGSVFLTAISSVTVSGTIDISGGRGGNGGNSASGYGGAGGRGGNNQLAGVIIDPNSISVGAISAQGGAGGYGGSGGIQGGIGGAGGAGAGGGNAYGAYGFGVELFAYGGSATVGNIDVSGGAGGSGGNSGGAGILGSAGGGGGYGGAVIIEGNTMVLGGVILAGAGNGGAGGAGSAGYGGNGGFGGYGGNIILIATQSINAITPLSTSVVGGTGGAGGATGGLAGPNGPNGAFFSSLEVGQASGDDLRLETNTAIKELNKSTDTHGLSGVDDLEKKDKEGKQKKEAAVCK